MKEKKPMIALYQPSDFDLKTLAEVLKMLEALKVNSEKQGYTADNVKIYFDYSHI